MGTAILPGLGQPGLNMPGASLTSNPGMMQLENGFNRNIFPMFGPASGSPGAPGAPSAPGALTSNPAMAGGANPLTAGVGNLTGTTTANPGNTNQFYPNQSLLQTTAPNLITGGSTALNAGLAASGAGLQTLQSPLTFYQNLLSMNPAQVTEALAPTAANISTIDTALTNQTALGMPGGGFRAAELAGLPFAQAAQVGNAALALQPQAAQGLAAIGGEQAQIGQGLAQTGTTLTGQGLTAAQAAMTGANQKQQINQQAGSVFGDIMQAIGAVSGLATGIGGLGGLLGGGQPGQTFTEGGDASGGINPFSSGNYNFYSPPPIFGDAPGTQPIGGNPFP